MKNNETVGSVNRPFIVGVGGFTSEIGKTTLLCELLHAFPRWEAIKTTRGHYRSCGKDPHACCVSHLLEDRAIVKSGREETYTRGKDTGRYWDAGAANVHWVIATDSEIHNGVSEALSRVKTSAVFIEGNSFSRTISPDFFVMVVHPEKRLIKSTARSALTKVSAFYASGASSPVDQDVEAFIGQLLGAVPKQQLFRQGNVGALAKQIEFTLTKMQPTISAIATS